MFAGWLSTRPSALGPPPLVRRFCRLWGTHLWVFPGEDSDGLRPEACLELLVSAEPAPPCSRTQGVSDWDGQDRNARHKFGFVLVTLTGGTLYCCANSSESQTDWMLHVRMQLEASFANEALAELRVSKGAGRRQQPRHEGRCAVTRQTLALQAATFCPSCGRGFSSPDLVEHAVPLPHLGREGIGRVCGACLEAELTLLWLKTANYAHLDCLHRQSEGVRADPGLFKATFRLQRATVSSLDMAGRLFEQGDISAEELAELRNVEHAAETDQALKNSGELFSALEAVGGDLHTVLGLLTSSSLIRAGDRHSYRTVLARVLQLAGELLLYPVPLTSQRPTPRCWTSSGRRCCTPTSSRAESTPSPPCCTSSFFKRPCSRSASGSPDWRLRRRGGASRSWRTSARSASTLHSSRRPLPCCSSWTSP